jgi:hypothetical protein
MDHVAAFNAIVERQARAEFEQREDRARAAVVAKVRDAMKARKDATAWWDETELDDLAEAAVDVFVELLRDPPTVEHHPDGTEIIRWPAQP